jgi:hypothetical protein
LDFKSEKLYGLGFRLGFNIVFVLDWISDPTVLMDFDSDLDSFVTMDWIGLQIRTFLWIWIQIWIHVIA